MYGSGDVVLPRQVPSAMRRQRARTTRTRTHTHTHKNWLPVATSRMSYCDRYWPHLARCCRELMVKCRLMQQQQQHRHHHHHHHYQQQQQQQPHLRPEATVLHSPQYLLSVSRCMHEHGLHPANSSSIIRTLHLSSIGCAGERPGSTRRRGKARRRAGAARGQGGSAWWRQGGVECSGWEIASDLKDKFVVGEGSNSW